MRLNTWHDSVSTLRTPVATGKTHPTKLSHRRGQPHNPDQMRVEGWQVVLRLVPSGNQEQARARLDMAYILRPTSLQETASVDLVCLLLRQQINAKLDTQPPRSDLQRLENEIGLAQARTRLDVSAISARKFYGTAKKPCCWLGSLLVK